MNRRAILAAGPALALVGAAPAVTPIMVLFREWLQLWAHSDVLCAGDKWSETEDEFNAVNERMIELEKAMMAAPKRNIIDIAIALAGATNFGVTAYEDKFFRTIQAEARSLIA